MGYAGAVNRPITNRYFLTAVLCGLLVSAGAQKIELQKQTAERKPSSKREPPPYWAFAINPSKEPAATAEPPDTTPRHVPDSEAAFTPAQVKDFFNPPDWHPKEHPPMPNIVAHGRPPDVFACGYCHLPNGQGRPENASLAGLSAAYIVQQLADFKNGLRKSSDPRHAPTSAMIKNETKANDEEITTAAEYFAALRPRPWIRVLETGIVPQTHVAGWMLVPTIGGHTEPIGRRIIETPENLERTELRDDHSGFIAYVPAGSIKKGAALARGTSGKTLRCATCHGVGLKGRDNVPALAGRSPSYIVRQLYDIRSGARAGVTVHAMKEVVVKLTVEDMAALAAYSASLKP
jgi:cytochrome c553